jgi:hypothetical protein
MRKHIILIGLFMLVFISPLITQAAEGDDWEDPYDTNQSDVDASADKGTEVNPEQANDSVNSLYMNLTEDQTGAAGVDIEDFVDAFDNKAAPPEVGTHSDANEMKDIDGNFNTMTEAQGSSYQPEENITDTFDSWTTDIDSYPDVGTDASHSNAQDNKSDSNYMTMQEANQGVAGGTEWLNVDGFTATWDAWNHNDGSSPYLDAQDDPTNRLHETRVSNEQVGWFGFQNTALSGSGISLNVSFYAANADGASNDGFDVYYDYTGGGGALLGSVSPTTSFAYITLTLGGTLTASQVDAFRVYLLAFNVGGGDDVYVDHGRIGVSQAASGDDYELDLEYQFTSVDFNNEYEYLITYIQTATVGGDQLKAWEWTGSAWSSIGTLTTNGWNNFTISSLTSSTYYIKFNDSDQAEEGTQSTWNMDAIFLRTSNDENNDYHLDLEFQFTGITNPNEANEELCIRTGNIPGTLENIRVFNYHLSVWTDTGILIYPENDSVWINTSVSIFITSSEDWFMFRAHLSPNDDNQDTWEIDGVLLHLWTDSTLNNQVDFEYQWNALDFDETNEEIAIYAGPRDGTEDLNVNYYDSGWNSLGTITGTDSWFNFTASFTGATYTIQLIGASESGDEENGNWSIDLILAHSWTPLAGEEPTPAAEPSLTNLFMFSKRRTEPPNLQSDTILEPMSEVLNLEQVGSLGSPYIANLSEEFYYVDIITFVIRFSAENFSLSNFGNASALTNGVNILFNGESVIDNANLTRNEDFLDPAFKIAIISDEFNDREIIAGWEFPPNGLLVGNERQLQFYIQDDMTAIADLTEFSVKVDGFKQITILPNESPSQDELFYLIQWLNAAGLFLWENIFMIIVGIGALIVLIKLIIFR